MKHLALKKRRLEELTDLLQELVDRSEKVVCIPIRNGWREVDTIEDFNNAIKDLEMGKL